jgi:hypothetical protein
MHASDGAAWSAERGARGSILGGACCVDATRGGGYPEFVTRGSKIWNGWAHAPQRSVHNARVDGD